MNHQDITAQARRLATTSVLPFAILLCAILSAVILTVFAMAQRANDGADERTRTILSNALMEEIRDIGRSLRAGIDGDPLVLRTSRDRERRLERMRRSLGLETIAVISHDGTLVAVVGAQNTGDGSQDLWPRESFRWVTQEFVRLTPRDASVGEPRTDITGRYAYERGALRVVAAISTRGANDGMAGLVGSRTLDGKALEWLGARLSIEGLTLAARSTPILTNELLLPAVDGSTGMRLSWTSERPGEPILERLVPIAAVGGAAVLLFSLLSFVHISRVTLSMLTSEAKAHHLAGHDTLSGLPNRMRFTEVLENALRSRVLDEMGVAVLFIDLDKFKEVNDTFGHEAGDMVIIESARRMRSTLRAGDLLARFGGDEFAIIQFNVRTPHDSELLARRVLDAIRPAISIGDAEVYVGASLGIALAPQNGSTASELMRLADIAMYRAKNDGRNRACFFEQRMDDVLRLRKIVEDDLRHAIERDELELLYQPQVSADGGRIVGVEGLLRWRHPVHGLISPCDFISIAEERGMIVQLGEWVIRRACLDGLRWPGITVACNVSAVQFRHVDFVQSIGDILAETGFDPTRLELELTEGVVVADADEAENCIIDLRAMGVRLALDDFGTGYSSLIYLRRFAFDKIKLDKSFLDSMEDTGESAILVHSVVHLGRALGLTVTAEGVETAQQQRFLQAVGCHLLQGYLFGKPMPAAEIDALLAAESRDQATAA